MLDYYASIAVEQFEALLLIASLASSELVAVEWRFVVELAE